MMQPAQILNTVSNLLLEGQFNLASELINDLYPFKPYVSPSKARATTAKNRTNLNSGAPQRPDRSLYTQYDVLQLYKQDGYVDRYTSLQLVCPASLYAISNAIPEAFPCGDRLSEMHQAFMELSPSLSWLDAKQGQNGIYSKRWLTTSEKSNQHKSYGLINPTESDVFAAGSIDDWDGLVSWYYKWNEQTPNLRDIRFNKGWHRAMLLVAPNSTPTKFS